MNPEHKPTESANLRSNLPVWGAAVLAVLLFGWWLFTAAAAVREVNEPDPHTKNSLDYATHQLSEIGLEGRRIEEVVYVNADYDGLIVLIDGGTPGSEELSIEKALGPKATMSKQGSAEEFETSDMWVSLERPNPGSVRVGLIFGQHSDEIMKEAKAAIRKRLATK